MSARDLWRSELLGEARELELPGARIECFSRGHGPAIVFCHGWLANANLWRKLVTAARRASHCIALDLPLGSHRLALDAGAELSPAGCGALIAAALDALELREVTLVGNDSGGAYSQIAAASRSRAHRAARAQLVRDALRRVPAATLRRPPRRGTRHRRASAVCSRALRDREVRASPAAYGLLIKHPIDELVSDSYALPCSLDAAVLRDTAAVMSSATSEPIHAAGAKLIASFKRPVLLAWSPEDQVFPLANARRYADALSCGSLALIEDAYSFTPEDQPEALAAAFERFIAAG